MMWLSVFTGAFVIFGGLRRVVSLLALPRG